MKDKINLTYRILALVCAIAILMPLSACDYGKKRVAILLSDKSNTFYSLIASSVTAIVNTKRDEATVYDAQNKVELQILQVQEAIRSGCTDIICIPVDVNYTDAITKLATGNDIPLVYVNRYPFKGMAASEIPNNVFYVGMEDKDAGEFQAKEYMADMPENKEKRIVILRGDLAENPTREWLKGIKSILEQDKFSHVVIEQNGKLDRVYSKIFVEALIDASERDPELEFNTILAYSDAMALGALDAIIARKMKDKVYISGINGGGESRKAVRKGLLPVSFFQDPSRQGNKAAEIIYAIEKGKHPEKINWVPLAKVKRLKQVTQEVISAEQSRMQEIEEWAREQQTISKFDDENTAETIGDQEDTEMLDESENENLEDEDGEDDLINIGEEEESSDEDSDD